MATIEISNNNLRVHAMLERFSRAVTSGDGAAAAQCWEVPALIVSQEGTRAVGSLQEIEAFFGAAARQYHEQGVTDTRPEVKETTWLTDRLAVVQVRWPYLDAQGKEVSRSESSSYVVRLDDAGEAKVSVAIMMGVQEG